MRWLYAEYILKGLYLGLLFFVALQEPSWGQVGEVFLCVGAGLAAALGIAAGRKLIAGQNVRGRILPFLVFLLLENPGLVYAGIIIGLAVGAHWVDQADQQGQMLYLVAGGMALGLGFWQVHQVQDRRTRWGLSLALAAAVVGGVLYWIEKREQAGGPFLHPTEFAALLLLGIPPFYLLTFAGVAEESEVEIGAMCAALGLATGILPLPPTTKAVAFVVPVLLYFLYTARIMPGLRVFKHAIRGMGHAEVGDYRSAIKAYRRALQLDPQNHLASEGMWSVHRRLDLAQIAREPETLALVDFDLCLQRASTLLLQPPTLPKLEEAHRLLDLVENQRPDRAPAVQYWRAVAYCHAQLFDQAGVALENVLDASRHAANNPHRKAILFPAWQLALVLHSAMIQRVGTPQLAVPGRRMEAIGAVERRLAAQAEDASAWELKRILYSELTEAEYNTAAEPGQPAADFDHGYAQQLGLALINDSARWQRGEEYLRMAARGLPALGPSIFTQIAQALTRVGNPDGARHNYELAKHAGHAVGPKNLSEEERQVYFAAIKFLGDDAVRRGDVNAAIEDFHLYTEYERSGIETLRTLADLHERRGEPLSALRATEQALVYNSSDKELLERKDKYYYSVLPADLQARLEPMRSAFDFAYCLRKARALLEFKGADLDVVDWAQHLLDLALVVQPESIAAKVLRARVHLRKGEKDDAVALLEALRSGKPEKFASAEDEEAWYLSCRLLGELYLYDLGKPDLAVACFNAFRKSVKSGADTLFKLGQAYEQLGDRPRAVKCYENVAAYDGHPLAPDASDALHRLQSS